MSMPMLSMTGTFLSNQILPIKGKWEALRQRRLNISDLSVTRENDPNEARETPGSEVDVDMQGINNDNNKISSTTSASNRAPDGTLAWPEGQEQVQEDCRQNGGKCSKDVPGSYSLVEPSTSAVTCAPSSVVDDEMLSWLHYPVDENFEKSYCSELFGDVPSSNMQTFNNNNNSNTSNMNNNNLNNSNRRLMSIVNLQKPPNAEAAMALGAERAAGLSSQVGHEAFCRVRTSTQPPVPKWPSATPSTTDIVSELHQHSKSFANFPIYSAPVTTTPSNFLVLQGPVQQQNSKAEKSSSFIGESVAATPLQRHESLETPHVKKEQLGSFTSGGGSSSCRTRSFENEERHHKSIGQKRCDPEATITSSSGGSENTTEKSEKSERVAEKRKAKQMSESTECQSEDVEGESVDTKKPARPKRSRAAEVHNLSERRRRDRINEKMRALQELIPNSNKTDKASMLDEAIEYLKMLQLQLQMMSMRSGMTLPPMVIPNGVQPMQVPHMTSLAPYGVGMGMVGMNMGMGMGMGMGVGMNMVDMAGSSSMRPMQTLQPVAVSEPQQQPQQHQQQQQQQPQRHHQQHQQLLGDSYNVYVSQPQMQVPVQVLDRDMYSSFLLPMAPPGSQQNNCQQQQQQQRQHQQQLHPGQQHLHGFNQ